MIFTVLGRLNVSKQDTRICGVFGIVLMKLKNYHFDRTWYGRVLVERVEGFASPIEWQRAYDEINRFEKTYLIAKQLW